MHYWLSTHCLKLERLFPVLSKFEHQDLGTMFVIVASYFQPEAWMRVVELVR